MDEMDMRVAPPQVNYDNILPMAIESRSNRREFLPVNGQSFSNTTGATIIRIDVNADSMLDATHSYLECDLRNDAGANTFLAPNQLGPSWISRCRIESGGVVIEDIAEYSRLYSMLTLAQTPKDYCKNNLANLGLYNEHSSVQLQNAGNNGTSQVATNGGITAIDGGTNAVENLAPTTTDLIYNMSAAGTLSGLDSVQNTGGAVAQNLPTAGGLAITHRFSRIFNGTSRKMCIPLVSGFLNMDKYIPLIMMNAGFTIELTLCDANRIGITQTETAAGPPAFVDSVWTIQNVRYVAHLIDLDRAFYDRLRMVMDDSGGVLQLAGQTYRHFSGILNAAASEYTISLPARVKSVKSIFGTFIRSDQVGNNANYDTSVFQRAGLTSFRFEIGSVRYPQTDVSFPDNNTQAQREAELDKAFGKIGDYQHQKAYSLKHVINDEGVRDGGNYHGACLSAFMVGYDMESFSRVLLENGVDTASRSLPINFICSKNATNGQSRADFYVLCDAIFYINLDGTASVSV